jgi:hypothetical protein
MPIEREERALLLKVARDSIERGLGATEPVPVPSGEWPDALYEWRATFTTLKIDGVLRGCRGAIEASRPLIEDVWQNAWASAYDDPRFPPVTADELRRLDTSISVLSPLEPIEAHGEADLLAQLEPGVDGLVLKCGDRRVTFLPSVWQMLPDPRTFLTQLKVKGGWSAGYWSSDFAAYRYRAETFPDY